MPLHRGRHAKHPEVLSVRPMTKDDVALCLEKRPYAAGAVSRFRDPHHRVARLFAAGLRTAEVVERSGYSYQRVWTLSQDPAFQELIAKYRDKVDSAFVRNADEFYETATANMRKAERMIAEKLDRADEEELEIPLKTLVDISADRMDRFGYGKRQTNLNINADFASMLEKAIVRSGKTIEAVATATSPQSPSGPAPDLQPPRESQFSDGVQEVMRQLPPARVASPSLSPKSAEPPLRRRA